MDGELWRELYHMVPRIAKGQTLKKATYGDADIVLTYLWSVLQHRPISWACQKKNWPLPYRRRPLPDNSTMSRRLRTEGVQRLLVKIEQWFIETQPARTCRWIDAKPLPIGRSSKDKQAGYGYANGALACGYKLHAVADASQGFVAWTIRPMQTSEMSAAEELIPRLHDTQYLVGDGSYDKNRLYDLAGQNDIQLIARQRIRDAKGIGHRKHSPYRLESLAIQTTPIGKSLVASRNQIECMFGQLTNLGCGLSPLPNWVRTSFRVENWVRGKMIIYHVWRSLNKRNAS